MAEKIQCRIMENVPIARSFQGILRVAPTLEIIGDEYNDYFFNPVYYADQTDEYAGIPHGNRSVKSFFDGAVEGEAKRFTFPNDKYRDKKVPVTDSIGNFINISVGENGTLVGSDELNNGNDTSVVEFTQILEPKKFKQSKVFPVISSHETIVGLSPKKLPLSKDVLGGIVNIDSSIYSSDIKAQLIVNNSFDHTESNRSGGVYKNIVDGKQRRTIYRITSNEPKEYDVLVHMQDDIDINNYNNGTIDSFVDILNLKDYVKEKMELWQRNNTSEVPTGNVIWQYISLKKWYNYNTETWTGNGDEPDLGHYPPMNKKVDHNRYTPTTYQGVVRKGLNRLAALSGDEDQETGIVKQVELKELIPLYKRDYVLCDGGTYYIYLLTHGTENKYDSVSYDMFKDLFFAIDYTYTSYDKIAPCKINEFKDGVYKWVESGIKYKYKESTENLDKHYRFTIDLSTMLAFRVIEDELINGEGCLSNGLYDRVKAQEWLKKQNIPSEYIFNTLVKNGGLEYHYKQAQTVKGETLGDIPIQIGQEVNNFSSKVSYYDHTEKNYVDIELWRTAEIQFILDLFEKEPSERDYYLSKNCVYSFQVPCFVQTTSDYGTGLFIGSSPYYWSEEARKNSITGTESVCGFIGANIPHRHFMFMGPSKFIGYKLTENGDYSAPDSDPLVTVSGANADSNSFVRAENAINYLKTLSSNSSRSSNVDSYSFAELSGTYYDIGMSGGLAVYTIQLKDNKGNDITFKEHKDPRWRNAEPNRGITSTMLYNFPDGTPSFNGDEKYLQAITMTYRGGADYFAPESVTALPLIKI